MKIVKVVWYDAYTRDGWESLEQGVNNCKQIMECTTVGYLLDGDENHVTICHTINKDLANKDSVMGMLHIPRECIKKLKVLG